MEERQDAVEDLLPLPQPRHPRHRLGDVGQQVPVGEHRALRGAGGAAGVLQQRDVGVRRPRVRRVQRGCLGDEVLPAQRTGRRAGDGRPGGPGLRHRQPQREPLRPRQRPGQVDGDDGAPAGEVQPLHQRGDLVPDDRDGRAVVGELGPQLIGGVQRVVLDHHRPEPQRGVERDDVLRAVGQHQGHPVAGADAEPAQRLCCAGHLVAELGVARGGPGEVQRRAVGEARRGLGQQVADGLLGHVHPGRHPGGVAADPVRHRFGGHPDSEPRTAGGPQVSPRRAARPRPRPARTGVRRSR
ncbi:hypothetical protein JD78_01604 [Modestobacter roseus]|uniref:Uncharacterized protein n=1 Tax=Modestobacter roseus TaxID=1181884 RepID=A0A562IQ17_9ACTN|nr:hypothetical protein JD78_01604 [Modestobacter roseus]